jgi:hypothetical protein
MAKVKAQVDLSKLTEAQQATRTAFLDLARNAFGETWQTPVAAALGRDKAQVAGWLAGRRPVPADVLADLQPLAIRWAADLQLRADLIRLRWDPDITEEEVRRITVAEANSWFPPEPPQPPRTPAQIVDDIAEELLLDVPMDSPSD